MKEQYLVSIITPSYNSVEYIEETIKSVLKQTYKNWEMIIVDDVSTDQSILIIEEFIKIDHRIKLIKLDTNSGAAVARNTAIEQASGSYIAFLDSDDIWHPCKLEKQLRFLKSNHYSFTYSFYETINKDGQIISDVTSMPLKVDYYSLLKTNYIGCLTVMYDVNYFGKVMMPLVRKRQDYCLWLKLLKKIDYAYCLNENLASYRVTPNSISSNKRNMISSIWYVYRGIESLSVIQSLYCLTHYILIGSVRKYLLKS